jgi:hypothetical protein
MEKGNSSDGAQRAVCQRLEHVGLARIHPDAQTLMSLHDRRAKMDSGLALAWFIPSCVS